MAKSRKRSESVTTPSPSTPTAAPAQQPAEPQANHQRSTDDYRQRVEQRAYELYLSRGGSHGSDWEDWLAAERELTINSASADDDRSDS